MKNIFREIVSDEKIGLFSTGVLSEFFNGTGIVKFVGFLRRIVTVVNFFRIDPEIIFRKKKASDISQGNNA